MPDLFPPSDLPTSVAPRRLFTALFPPPEASAAIDAARRGWGGLPARLHPQPERMHLTLQFFNRVDAPHAKAWAEQLAALRFEPFELGLQHAELWEVPSGTIAVLRPVPSAALAALHQATALLARQAGLPASTEDWRPHLTTLRRAKALRPAPLPEPVAWTVRAVDLIWSDLLAQPPSYRRLERFPAEG